MAGGVSSPLVAYFYNNYHPCMSKAPGAFLIPQCICLLKKFLQAQTIQDDAKIQIDLWNLRKT